MLKFLILYILYILLLFATACGSKTPPNLDDQHDNKLAQHEHPEEVTYTLIDNGNPDEVFKGVEFNKKSLITIDNYHEFSGKYVHQAIESFEDRVLFKNENHDHQESILEVNKAPGLVSVEDTFYDTNVVSFKKSDNTEFDIQLSIAEWTSDGEPFVIYMNAQDDGSLLPVSIEGDLEIDFLHWSFAEDLSGFSMLFRYSYHGDDNEIVNKVTAYYFSKIPEEFKGNDFPDNKDFEFIMGRNNKVRWQIGSTVTLSICGETPAALREIYEDAVNKWAEIVAPYFTLKVNYLKNPPPFSDLNTNCIITLRNFTMNSKNSSPMGRTASLINYSNNLLSSTHIYLIEPMIYEDATWYNWNLLDITSSVLEHEIGHALGLDHKFKSYTASIMSYKKFTEISVYDKLAIKFLYDDEFNGTAEHNEDSSPEVLSEEL